ncbi:ABC1 family-domain-containing protein [Absidia repens]|uniref:ABC1 family-domain-containing protein n=1 Tax=Absidia repens TaxID=90262 RepID=A0A1X2I131_9FUNG|nr:ABC1 family-domain-containing protein [Absidia repens]
MILTRLVQRIPRRTRWLTCGTVAGLYGGYVWDDHTEAKLVQRNLRTFYHGMALAVDYKWHGGQMETINALHERVANRIFDVFERNGGLYIKMGQVIAAQSAVLPAAYQRRARTLLDAAPAVPLASIERVFLEEYGALPNDVFAWFDPHPIASASIAQVHRARLKDTGEWVAVKIQKPAVQRQLGWDLYALRALLHMYEYLFELPLTFAADYIEMHIRKEVDFENEARNGQRAWDHLSQVSDLKDKVYIPKIYPEISTRRVLVCEWIDQAVQLTDREKITDMGLDYKEAMKISIEAFASQIFLSGFVHGDPHAGNVLVTRHPKRPNKVRVVLVDHGLYVEESERFRQQYCKLWQSLFMLDLNTMSDICAEWGIHDVDMFASITLQKPFVADKPVQQSATLKDIYEFQSGIKARLKHFLEDQAQFPRELIFLLRNMEIVRGNNKMVGSPVNRLNIMASWAVRGLDEHDHHHGLQGLWRRFVFRFTLCMMSISFWLIQLRQQTSKLLFGTTVHGFEDLVDDRMKEQMYLQYGIQIDENVFDA